MRPTAVLQPLLVALLLALPAAGAASDQVTGVASVIDGGADEIAEPARIGR